MTKLRAPLFTLIATGPLSDVVAYTIRRGQPCLLRKRTPRTTWTQKQKAIRSFTTALTQAWAYWHTLIQDYWAYHPQTKRLSPYHAYLWENHQRRKRNLWPIAHWGETADGSASILTAPTWDSGPQRLSVRLVAYTNSIPWIAALFHNPLVPLATQPQNARAWTFLKSPPTNQSHILRVAPDTYQMWIQAADFWGRASNARTQTGLLVTS